MPVATTRTVSLQGATGHPIDVQVDVSQGPVGTTVVGRADISLHEARNRCRMTVHHSGYPWPATRRVTILLSPADLLKTGTHFDLAVADVVAVDRRVRAQQPTRLIRRLNLLTAGEASDLPVPALSPAPGAPRWISLPTARSFDTSMASCFSPIRLAWATRHPPHSNDAQPHRLADATWSGVDR